MKRSHKIPFQFVRIWSRQDCRSVVWSNFSQQGANINRSDDRTSSNYLPRPFSLYRVTNICVRLVSLTISSPPCSLPHHNNGHLLQFDQSCNFIILSSFTTGSRVIGWQCDTCCLLSDIKLFYRPPTPVSTGLFMENLKTKFQSELSCLPNHES